MNYAFGLLLVTQTIYLWCAALVPAMCVYLAVHIIRRSMSAT